MKQINYIKCKNYTIGLDSGDEYDTTVIGRYDKKGVYHIIAIETINKMNVMSNGYTKK